MAWSANPESDIAGYRVLYGTFSGEYSLSQIVGTSPEATLSGLAPGLTYFCAVQAFNTSGLQSPPSAEISFTIPAAGLPEIAVELPGGSVLIGGQSDAILSKVNLGSTGAAETFIIRNLGAADLTGLSVTADGQEFTIAPPATSTLAPGDFTSFQVTFSPSLAGTRTTVIHINSNDADENPFDIEVHATGVAAPEITIQRPGDSYLSNSGSAVHFNHSLPSATEIFTITNTGTADLTGLTLSTSGSGSGDFIFGPPAVSILAPGASTTFSIAFRPTVSGLRTATLHVASNDADESPFDIALVGNRVAAPDISITQAGGVDLTGGLAPITLESVNLGATGASHTFTIANLGDAVLSDLGIRLDGNHSSDFLVESHDREFPFAGRERGLQSHLQAHRRRYPQCHLAHHQQ